MVIKLSVCAPEVVDIGRVCVGLSGLSLTGSHYMPTKLP